jgi:hypothetical protein
MGEFLSLWHFVCAKWFQRERQPMASNDLVQPRIVTRDLIQHIQHVIRDTSVPSWIETVPHNYGEAAAGTLKADEWRTLATIYLPIALISYWGYYDVSDNDSSHAFQRRALDHVMCLFVAVRLVTMCVLTKTRIIAYRDNIISYLAQLKTLFPEADMRTNYHMAIHIYDFLLLFGPVKSWWCFPFERLIGILQNQPSNHKLGKHLVLML